MLTLDADVPLLHQAVQVIADAQKFVLQEYAPADDTAVRSWLDGAATVAGRISDELGATPEGEQADRLRRALVTILREAEEAHEIDSV